MKYDPIPGQPHNPSEEETMSMIRSVLTEADAPAPTRRAAGAAGKAQADAGAATCAQTDPAPQAFVERTGDPGIRRRADDLPELRPSGEQDTPAPRETRIGRAAKSGRGHLAAPVARLRAFRPSTRHLAIVSMALLVALRPHWFVISGVLVVAMIVGTFLILGSDRIWRGVLGWLARVDRRDPERAMRLRAGLDGLACRWDAILDRFPDGMVDGLYMPDLQAMQDADAAHTRAMAARLDRMVQEG